MARRRRAGWWIGAVALVVVVGLGIYIVQFLQRNQPERHAAILEHFKYGSIGSDTGGSLFNSETDNGRGVPASLWLALPVAFPDHMPKGRGTGYERLGFLYEPGKRRPIGTSFREAPFGQIGLNCAVCHTATVRESPSAPRRTVFGMPANQFDLRSYLNFLRDVGKDEHFNAETLIPAIRKVDPDFSLKDELIYRHLIIPRTRTALREIDTQFGWMDRQPEWGPGRVDTFNPYKARFFAETRDPRLDPARDGTVGTADLPTLWNQRPRRRMYLHWDGNNNRVEERNISAAIGAGATESSLDEPSMNRIAKWILDFKPPPYPAERIDRSRARRGARIYRQQCAACHAFDGSRVGQVEPIDRIGTDRERLDSFTPELVPRMNTLGTGRPWRFRHFRKTNGYANMPLDGVWLRAPYLHNGSVPDLRALLSPEERPKVFYRNYDVYDWERVGFVSQGAEARRVGFRFDTSERGNGNGGHLYGARLSAADKEALIEYLKGL